MGDLYVPCPRCKGSRFVTAIVRPGNGWSPTVSEDFTCPLCAGTGEAEAELAAEYQRDREDAEEEG